MAKANKIYGLAHVVICNSVQYYCSFVEPVHSTTSKSQSPTCKKPAFSIIWGPGIVYVVCGTFYIGDVDTALPEFNHTAKCCGVATRTCSCMCVWLIFPIELQKIYENSDALKFRKHIYIYLNSELLLEIWLGNKDPKLIVKWTNFRMMNKFQRVEYENCDGCIDIGM